MKDDGADERIIVDPAILMGKPVIRGTRIPVSLIVNYMEHGHAVAELLDDYPNLTSEDVEAALAYARSQVDLVDVRSL